MRSAREWLDELLLRSPASLRSLRDIPFMGNLIHRLSHRMVSQDHKVWARVESGAAQGLWLELKPRTGQSYARGEVETTVQSSLVERLRPGMIFYDLGANIGLFTLLGARLVGETGRVFSFEPDPVNAARLRRNIVRNQFENVTIVEAGVWSSSGEFDFVAADERSPDRGVGKFIAHDGRPCGTPTRCVSLDDFILAAPAPDAVKCDVEGAEIEVLCGAVRTLRMKRPWIICETHSLENDRCVRKILSRLGYTLETMDNNHVVASP
jgi:FkbM family methyltransferase